MIRYLSICSGIEAASVAWKNLGWVPIGFSEIDAFPSAVLNCRYPSVKNYGDFTTIRSDEVGEIDLIVGGTPCQSFSVAGRRDGLQDERGNLTLEFIKLLGRIKPRWFVWENVPGVLSIDGGRTFYNIVDEMQKLGYGVSWRILDAQNFGVPQRRRRIFIVGSLGNLGSGKVLFEQGCLQADFGACEETGEEVAGTFSTGFGSRRMSINGIGGGGIPQSCVAYTEGSIGSYVPGVGTLRAAGGDLGHGAENLIVYSDDAEKSTGLKQRIVRKLTPVECERLQGFPDNYTRIPWRKKAPEDCPDGLRYKVLGNSMAVPVMRWIGERINKVDSEVFRKWDYIL